MEQGNALTRRIEQEVRRQWADPRSLTCRNRALIPAAARRGFVLFADAGGLCVLDSSGAIRVFAHSGEEVRPNPSVGRAALRALRERYPEIAALYERPE